MKEISYPPQKKLLKRKEKHITQAKTNAPVSQTSSERLKVAIQIYQMGKKELKMKLGQLHEEMSKASLPVSADLSNDFKSIILETDQRKLSPFMRLFWEEQQKCLQSSQNNATYYPMIFHIRQSIYLILTNVLPASFLMFHITFVEISTALSIQFW